MSDVPHVFTDMELRKYMSLDASSRLPLAEDIALSDDPKYLKDLAFMAAFGLDQKPLIKFFMKAQLSESVRHAVGRFPYENRLFHAVAQRDPMELRITDMRASPDLGMGLSSVSRPQAGVQPAEAGNGPCGSSGVLGPDEPAAGFTNGPYPQTSSGSDGNESGTYKKND